jgi:hypothetical protein
MKDVDIPRGQNAGGTPSGGTPSGGCVLKGEIALHTSNMFWKTQLISLNSRIFLGHNLLTFLDRVLEVFAWFYRR